jgi:mono/diheme cytochrome c family protein
MRRFLWAVVAAAGAFGPARAAAPQDRAPSGADFVRDIQPIFKTHCLSCHGEKKQKGRFRLDAKGPAFRGGVSGPAIVPGNSAKSRLVQLLIEKADDERMPQDAPPLAPEKIALIRAWIDQGAAWPDVSKESAESHWSYLRPIRRDPPGAKNASWVRNPVDAFLTAEREARGLKPRPEAPRQILLRRLTLDLIGLPPTREELHAFLADTSPDAYEKAVDRLLADPRYGERWGRHFMDVWRYSDWGGWKMEVRDSVRHIWRWRDWIVDSLNEDKGYDRMVVEMLAGDEVAPGDPATLRATGFLARNWYKFSRNVWLERTVEHTSKAFLGVTMNCARCHSHFFDPISQEEYYAFRAFFEPHQIRTDRVPGETNIEVNGLARAYDAEPQAPTYLFARGDEKNPDKDRPIAPAVPRSLSGAPLAITPIPLPPAAVAPDRQEFVRQDLLKAEEKDLSQARAKVDTLLQAIAQAEGALVKAGTSAEDIEKSRQARSTALEELPLATMAKLIAEAKRAALQAVVEVERIEDSGKKGADEWKKAAEAVSAAQRTHTLLEARRAQVVALRAVAKLKSSEKRDEKALGEAKKKLDDVEKGLAKAEKEATSAPTTSYTPRPVPSYPATSSGRRLALARWIASPENPLTARVAVNHVWMRHFGKPLVPTVFDFGHHGKPPTHPALLDWLATELVREQWSLKNLHRLLVTSSAYRMDSSMDASDFAKDPENQFLWRANARRMEAELVRDSVLYAAGELDLTRGGPELDHQEGLSIPRRSLYFRHAPEKQVEFLALFDAANMVECYERSESVVPQQALALENSPLTLEASRRLAAKLSKEAPDQDAFIRTAFERILSRAPGDTESSECGRFLSDQARLLCDRAKLTAFVGGSAPRTAPSPDPSQRARENLVQALFNLNDFVTIR